MNYFHTMIYRVIGLMSGSSLDGLDIAFVELHEAGGKWTYEVKAAVTYAYSSQWAERLSTATTLSALDYQLLHTAFGHYCGVLVNRFIEEYNLQYQAQLISSHGHTTFHVPASRMTAQLGDGAAIAAVTGINVVTDLRAMDIAFGGNGAPIVPIGEKLLLGDYPFFLNIGGIANISCNKPDGYIGFDVCPANRVLNLLAGKAGKTIDDNGELAATGKVIPRLLESLNELAYYELPYPKSLSNDFGTKLIFPLLNDYDAGTTDLLCTYCEHIAIQVQKAVGQINKSTSVKGKMCITGGGAHNGFLINRLSYLLKMEGIDIVIPEKNLVDYKEAVIMALIGLLRWREENNVLSTVTGATRDSIGGAVWIGQEA